MVQTAIQLYTLRDVDRPLPDLLERVAEAGFDGVEFAYRVTEHDPETVVETLEQTGLDAAGAHVPIETLEDDLDTAIERYRALGCENVVVPHLDESFFGSREGVERAAERLAPIADRLSEAGMALHYHNHDHEFVPLDGTTGFDAFVEATDVGLELDLGFVLLAGGDPVERLDELRGRVSLAHLKDVDADTGESVPVGEGDLDVAACAETFRESGGEWLIYEYEGPDPMASLDDVGERMGDLRDR